MLIKRKEPRVEVVYDYKHQGSDTLLTPATVWLRVYYSRTQRKYISTGVRVLPCQWSERYWVVGREDSAQLNKKIRDAVQKAERTICAALDAHAELPSTHQMKVDSREASFLDFVAAEIEKAKIKSDTKRHHICTYNLLTEWGKMRRFEQVTKSNILAYLDWIANREVMKPSLDGTIQPTRIKQCTVHDHWKRLRKYISIAQGEQLIPLHVTKNLTVDRGEYGERVHLSDKEMGKWMKTRMPIPSLEMARLRFIVQMGCGMSYSDLMSKDFTQCEEMDGWTVLHERRNKTGGDFFCIIMPFAVRVLKKWDFKIPAISNVDYNKYLERVAQKCKIRKHITSHVARHTYACYCLRHGVRTEAVKRTLGHKKLETTQIYARLVDRDVLDSFNNALLNKI